MTVAASVEISPGNQDVIRHLHALAECSSPVIRDFWEFMLVCFDTPRPSTNFDGSNNEERAAPFRRVMKSICNHNGLNYSEDTVGNIIISNFDRTVAKAEYCFQGHMDVVVSKNDSVEHDFEKSGVDVYITKENTVKPIKGITLGADNGVSIACGLSVMINNRNHPLELLITKNEETSFEGALGLDPTQITADFILNLDSEVENEICVGSAGGFAHHIHLPVERKNLEPSEKVYRLRLRDLKGGHSGCDIDKQRGNAIIEMSRLLLIDNVKVISFEGGTATNAIPRECDVVIACNEEDLTQIKSNFDSLKSELLPTDPLARLAVDEIHDVSNSKPLSSTDSKKLIGLILAINSGVVKRRHSTGEIEASYNLGTVFSESSSVTLKSLVRSTSLTWMKTFSKQLTAIASLAGALVDDFEDAFGAWEPNFSSKIVERLTKYRPRKDVPLKLYTVHAGLECSTILERFASVGRKNVECASIGPLIENAHSPDECLHIDSAADFVRWVDNLVNERE
jgi:dipeptidase D